MASAVDVPPARGLLSDGRTRKEIPYDDGGALPRRVPDAVRCAGGCSPGRPGAKGTRRKPSKGDAWMGAKQLTYSDEARQKLLSGVGKLARAVRCTLGPRGRNAVLDKGWGSPNVTKDGVTVAEEIELQDPYENMGAQLVKEAASKTSDVAGDGTTTATVLAEAMYREGLKSVAGG